MIPATEQFDPDQYCENNYPDYFWDFHQSVCRRIWQIMHHMKMTRVPFKKAGQVSLKSIIDPRNDKGKTARFLLAVDLAIRIDSALSVTHRIPLRRSSRCEVINQVSNIFLKEDSTLADLAVYCDHCYEFSATLSGN